MHKMLDFLKFGTKSEIPQPLSVEDESPASAEIFSLEQLKARAAELASSHRIAAKGKRGFDLLACLL